MKLRPLLSVVLLAGLAAPSAAWAAGGADEGPSSGSRLELALTLYAGGITLGKADMDATISGNDYRVVSNLSTSGVVNAFWQSEIQATSSGKLGDKSFTPALYNSFYTGRNDRKQEVSLTYENQQPRLYANPTYSTTGFEVKPEEKKASLDPLSAILMITSGVMADANNPCGYTAPVFDGRRRYDLIMTKVKDTNIALDNGIYKGKAVQCLVKYKQVAGFRPGVTQRRPVPDINMVVTTVPSSIAGRNYVVPLRLWSDTPFGPISVVANTIKVDGAPIKSGG